MRAPGPIDQSTRSRITLGGSPTSSRTRCRSNTSLPSRVIGKPLQHKGIAWRWLVGDQLVGGLYAELRLRGARRRTAPQPRQLLAHQVLAARLGPGREPHPLGTGQHVGGITAVVGVDRAAVHLPRPGAHRVQEPAVVADHHQRLGRLRSQVPGQPADHLHVEVVGRLVEHQHVVARQQHPGQRHPAPLTAAQPADSARRDPRPPSRCSTTSRVSGSAAHTWSGRPPTMTSRTEVPRIEVVGLPQIAHRQSGGVGDATRIGHAAPRSALAAAWSCRRRCGRRRRSHRPRRRRG